MAGNDWVTRRVSVASLHLDAKNPRLGRETLAQAPREIIQYLFEHDKALEVAESIATRGFFPNEPLLVVIENSRLVVVEGNRRLGDHTPIWFALRRFGTKKWRRNLDCSKMDESSADSEIGCNRVVGKLALMP